jgi:putative transposase
MRAAAFWLDTHYVQSAISHQWVRCYESVTEARDQLAGYFEFYNGERPHSALGARTPDAAYFDSTAVKLAA